MLPLFIYFFSTHALCKLHDASLTTNYMAVKRAVVWIGSCQCIASRMAACNVVANASGGDVQREWLEILSMGWQIHKTQWQHISCLSDAFREDIPIQNLYFEWVNGVTSLRGTRGRNDLFLHPSIRAGHWRRHFKWTWRTKCTPKVDVGSRLPGRRISTLHMPKIKETFRDETVLPVRSPSSPHSSMLFSLCFRLKFG